MAAIFSIRIEKIGLELRSAIDIPRGSFQYYMCMHIYIESTEVLARAIISQQHERTPSPSMSEKRLTTNPGALAPHAQFAVLSRKLNSSGRDISEVRRGPPRRYISIRLRGSKICRRRFLNSPAELTSLFLSREMYRRCSSGEEKKARRRFTY